MHKSIDLPILYFGTPVVLISTLNEDGSTNVAPSSSIWWLGKSCMIGLDGSSKTTENLKRTKQCVLNLPSADCVDAVDRLANTTGTKRIPLHKKTWGYRYVKNKIAEAGLSTVASNKVKPPRVVECQVQLEASVEKIHRFCDKSLVPMFAFELEVIQSHVEESILMGDKLQYVNPDHWHPLIMSFRKFYTTHDYIHPSRLESAVSVEKYRVKEFTGLGGRLLRNSFRLLYRRHFKLDR
ncbi:MAG: flavin reductase [Moraxellaceae bacterium]|nr:MAG: flavin reductase [Moraxellaceae bacterium]